MRTAFWFVLCVLAVALLGSLAFGQTSPSCEYRVYLQAYAILPKDLKSFDSTIAHDHSFCRVSRIEDANLVFVLTRTNVTSAGAIPIPHTARAQSTVTGYGSQMGDFTATVNTTSTSYELRTVPTSCEQVHLYVYRKDEPQIAFHSSYIDVPLGKSLLSGFAMGLMATSGTAPTPSACDYGRSKPAKDVTTDAMKALRSGTVSPAPPPQETKTAIAADAPPVGEVYLGSWRSQVFNASGQIAMRLSIRDSQ